MITVQHLTKRFGRFVAVRDLGFEVRPGESIALWGSNGAGKTTALRCMLGVVPFEGSISIGGFDIARSGREARRLIGFVPQELNFHDNLDVFETLEFYARLKKVRLPDNQAVLDRLSIGPMLDKTVRDLSGGMKQRLALAVALLGDPPILFLDEPTANLDVRSRDTFLELLVALKARGKTLVFTSHHLDEVAAVADRILLLQDGRLETDCSRDELRTVLGWREILWVAVPQDRMDQALATVAGAGIEARRNCTGIHINVQAGEKGRALELLVNAGIPVRDFASRTEGRHPEGIHHA